MTRQGQGMDAATLRRRLSGAQAALSAGDGAGAAALAESVLAVKPDLGPALFLAGEAWRLSGRLEEAAAALSRAWEKTPGMAEIPYRLGLALAALGRADDALAAFDAALALRPDWPHAHQARGALLSDLRRLQPAIADLERAVALAPHFAPAWNNLSLACFRAGRHAAAIRAARQALALDPAMAEAHYNLGSALHDQNRLDEAAACFRAALALKPDLAEVRSSLLVTLPFLSGIPADALAGEFRRFGAVHEPALAAERRPHANDPDPERRLKVAYLSPSLRGHVIWQNMAALWGAHDRSRVELHVYAHVPRPDSRTRQLRALADRWTDIHALNDAAVAERMRHDGIDVAIHPIGHWINNRLLVLARRPAPVQVSYLFNSPTTGLSCLDAIIADRWLNFDGRLQDWCSEPVVELESGFHTTMFDIEPFIAPEPPLARNGFVTFGSFNNPAKLSQACLGLWGRVLAAVPGSRLLLKWHRNPGLVETLLARFEAVGVARERIEIAGWRKDRLAHYDLYNAVDVVLDSTPFTGGRTTEDALWMGVPVVTLVGDGVPSRLSFDFLSRIGAPELCAWTEEAYVAQAQALAADPARLAGYRARLRDMMRASSIMDHSRHAAELEAVLRRLWREWCRKAG